MSNEKCVIYEYIPIRSIEIEAWDSEVTQLGINRNEDLKALSKANETKAVSTERLSEIQSE